MKKFIRTLMLAFFFILPVLLWLFVSALANTMRWKLGSPFVSGYNWMRWSHLYLAGGSLFCLLLYVHAIFSVIRKKMVLLSIPFVACVVFLIFSIGFFQKSRQVFYKQAIEKIDEEIAKNPNDSKLIEEKANALDKMGEHDKAIELFNKALEITTTPAYVIHDRGSAYSAKKEYEKAVQDFTEALEKNPSEQKFAAQCHNDRGVAYFHNGQYEQSWEDVKKAIELGYRVHTGFLSALEKKGYRR